MEPLWRSFATLWAAAALLVIFSGCAASTTARVEGKLPSGCNGEGADLLTLGSRPDAQGRVNVLIASMEPLKGEAGLGLEFLFSAEFKQPWMEDHRPTTGYWTFVSSVGYSAAGAAKTASAECGIDTGRIRGPFPKGSMADSLMLAKVGRFGHAPTMKGRTSSGARSENLGVYSFVMPITCRVLFEEPHEDLTSIELLASHDKGVGDPTYDRIYHWQVVPPEGDGAKATAAPEGEAPAPPSEPEAPKG